MSWTIPKEYKNEFEFEQKLKAEKAEAHKILMDSGLVSKAVFTDCMIPLQIHVILPTGEMCYGRNARVGGNVTMWVFETECDLRKGWPPVLFTGERISDATDYIILVQEMIVLIKEYLQRKKAAVSS